MTIQEPGSVITFYSYKGGTGRTMALANIACLLAQDDKKVLMIDWDLEAPGLHRYFHDYLTSELGDVENINTALRERPGLIDVFLRFREQLNESDVTEERADILFDSLPLEKFILKTDIKNLHLLKAGHIDADYAHHVNSFQWEDLYNRTPWLFRSFAERLAKEYQYILIDSRTGLTDVSGICTMLMPDTLVAVFTPNHQNLDGLMEIIKAATNHRRASDDFRPLTVFPLASRIEMSEEDLRDDWRFGDEERSLTGYEKQLTELFVEVYDLSKCELRMYFDLTQIPHRSYYAYGEEIAILGERDKGRLSLTQGYENFTNWLIHSEGPWDDIITPDAVTIPTIVTPPAPPANFTGRREHLELLKNALTGRQETVVTALQGMGGIGKTATALKLAVEVRDDFPGGIFWGSLPDHEGNPIPILLAWGRACGHDLSIESNQSVLDSQLRHLLAARQAEIGRLLVILDDVRTEWLKAAQRLKQTVPPEAALLLTTRDERLATFFGAAVHRLDVLPQDEALALLKAHAGAAVVEAEREAAEKLLTVVGYLPLAIELAGKQLMLRSRKAGYRLATLTEAVSQRATATLNLRGDPGLAATFAITYESLSSETQLVFRWLGIFATGPLYLASVASVLGLDETTAEQRLDELVLLALLAWGETEGYYMLHPLLRQYAQTLLVETDETEVAGLKHLDYYLTYAEANAERDLKAHHRLEAALPNLLKAVDFAVQVKAHQAVSKFGYILYGSSHFLDVRGYSREALSLLERSVNACRELGDRLGEGNHLGNLGIAYSTLGQVEQAIACYEQALSISRELGDRLGEGNHLGNLGNAYRDLGQVERAIEFYEQALSISRELGDRLGEGNHLGNLGTIYSDLGEVSRAIGHYEQALSISREIGDHRGEGNHLSNLGNAYYSLGQVERAIEFYEQALSISREIGDRLGEGNYLGNLGIAYRALGQVEQAIALYEQALSISREIGDRLGEGNYLGNLGNAYYSLGQVEQAIEFYEQALSIAQEIGYRQGEGTWLGNLGEAYRALGQVERAIEFYEQALVIAREIGDRPSEGMNLDNLGSAYHALGQVEQAKQYLQKSLVILEEIKSPNAAQVREWISSDLENN